MAKVFLFFITIAMTCLAIDIGYVVAVRCEMLNIEDASTLAAALQRDQIPDGWDQWGRPNHWYPDIREVAARQSAQETFQKNAGQKLILRNITFDEVLYQKINNSRYKVYARASVPLPLSTKFLQAFGYAAPDPWPVVAESIGGFR
ncbi:hypothetical protein M5X11_28095 [Paenibacillus alginolyticus]|uniref:hypothetical protein n=1 Tax=Paenibacillus alginolyticus TaxID=59839 RepID=UPI0003FB289E|nr:hypothetical protein [Paenibacillus alginolyticus]MCY9668740.1 hypothetical protein [Paenibacillus alginolyticus]